MIGLGGGGLVPGEAFLIRNLASTQGTGPAGSAGNEKGADTLLVSKTGTPHAVPLTGFNANWLELPVEDERFLDTLRTFEPDLVRYPGGGVSDYWSWRKGGIDLEELPAEKKAWRRLYGRHPNGLDQLKSVLEGLGADPVFVLNALTSTLEEQRALLNAAAAKGIEVKYIEMGNEYFFGEEDHLQRFPSAEKYAVQMSRWAHTLKKDFPGAEISAVGGFAYRGHSDRRRNWNSEVKEHFPNREATSFHPYMLLNEDQGTNQEKIESYTKLPEETLRRAYNLGFDDYPSTERLWITEYNTRGKVRYRPALRETWMHGLLVAAYSLLLMQDEQVEMLLPHQIAGQEALYRAVETPRWGGSYGVTTYGEAIRHLFGVMDDHSTVQQLTFERKKPSGGESSEEAELVVGNVFDSSTAVVVNLRDSQMLVRLGSLFEDQDLCYQWMSLSDPLRNGVEGKDLEREQGPSAGDLSIPPFSIVTIN
jgi:YHS domain-containing protein